MRALAFQTSDLTIKPPRIPVPSRLMAASGHQARRYPLGVSPLEPAGYYQLLAAEDCSMVLGQLTFWLPPKLTSMPSGSKSSMPPLLKKPSLPKKKPRSRKPSLVPEPEPSCTNEEP